MLNIHLVSNISYQEIEKSFHDGGPSSKRLTLILYQIFHIKKLKKSFHDGGPSSKRLTLIWYQIFHIKKLKKVSMMVAFVEKV